MPHTKKRKMYKIGDVLSTPGLLYRHYMIVVGPNLVVHASKENGVIPAWLSNVTADKHVINHGRWGEISNFKIILRAISIIGMPYDLFKRNCEHVVRYASGVKVESPQIQLAVTAALVVGALFFIPRQR